MEDPQILIGLSWMGDGWLAQARVRNDLGLFFGAAVDFSGLASAFTESDLMDQAVAGACADVRSLSPNLGEPSLEGELLIERMATEYGIPIDEF